MFESPNFESPNTNEDTPAEGSAAQENVMGKAVFDLPDDGQELNINNMGMDAAPETVEYSPNVGSAANEVVKENEWRGGVVNEQQQKAAENLFDTSDLKLEDME